jgi:CBS domain-containing protein
MLHFEEAEGNSRMRAEEIMTRDVVAVRPETPVTELAQLFAERGISGAPVVDAAGTLCGIVTESDLMRRVAAGAERQPGFLRSLLSDPAELARNYARAHGRTAQDVMTTDPLTLGPDVPVARVAELLEEKDIRRVPIVAAGRLLGVVSRADLLKAVLAAPADAPGAADDATIRRELAARLRAQPWADRQFLHAAVKDGHVHFTGFARSPAVGQGLRALAEGVPGVRGVTLDLAPPPPFMFGMT